MLKNHQEFGLVWSFSVDKMSLNKRLNTKDPVLETHMTGFKERKNEGRKSAHNKGKQDVNHKIQ